MEQSNRKLCEVVDKWFSLVYNKYKGDLFND